MSSDHDDLSRWEAALERKEEELLKKEEELVAKEEELRALEARLKSQSGQTPASSAASETSRKASNNDGWQVAGTTGSAVQSTSGTAQGASVGGKSEDGASPGENICKVCKSALSYIDQYHRWYCHTCKEYR